MNKNESFSDLSFSEIELFINGGFAMFYLYIDDVLISEYHNFSEVRDFIFDFYYALVKHLIDTDIVHCGVVIPGISMDDFTKFMDDQMDHIITGLCKHNYEYFRSYDHEVQVYYGYKG